jgi:hypothetical protein
MSEEDRTQGAPAEAIRPRHSGSVLWGLFLIAVGAAFLYQRLMGAEIPRIWDLWPLTFFVFGTNYLFDRRPGSAVTMYLIGFWFLGVNFDWFGMTFRNSWPLFLIAIGTGMVIKAFSREEDRPRRGVRC